MHITDVEALKSWISKFVTSLTDAEPLTFAKYVVALLKKEKSKEDLQAICLRDLEIFLNTHTTEFVRELFAVLHTDEYIGSIEKTIDSNNKPTNHSSSRDAHQSTNRSNSRDGHNLKLKSRTSDRGREKHGGEEKRVKSVRGEEVLRGSDDLREKLGRSREDRHKNDDKQMPKKHHEDREEVKGRSRHTQEDIRRPHHRRHLKRSHSRHRNRSQSPHRSKYPSPSRRHKTPSPSPRSSTMDARHRIRGNELMRARSPSKHSEGSGSVTSESGGEEGKHFRHTVPIDHIQPNNICPQFAEKGVCMQGPLCRFDHGANPLILKHISSQDQNLPTFPGEVGAEGVGAPPQHPHLFLRSAIPPGLIHLPYPGIHYLPPNVPTPILQQPPPLVPPTSTNPTPLQPPIITHPPPQPMFHYAIMQHPPPSSQILNSKSLEIIEPKPMTSVKDRLGDKVVNLSSTIELRNLPPHLNNITSINQQLSPFGNIMNIQVCYRGDNGCAVVTFTSDDCVERVLAHPQAFFNNRFVQVQRATTQQQQQQQHVLAGEVKKGVKERLGTVKFSNTQNPSNDRRVVLTTSNKVGGDGKVPTHKLINRVNLKADVNKEVLKRTLELNQQRRLLLLQNCEKIKILVKKAEGVAADQRNIIIQQIKALNEHNEKLKMQMSTDADLLKSLPTFRTHNIKQQLDKAILDAELDLMAGNDSQQLKNKIALLKLQASSLRNKGKMGGRLGSFRGRYRGHARGRISYQGRDFKSPQHLIDRRPKQLIVRGFSSQNKQQVLQHFRKLGKIEDENEGQLVVTFPTRRNAEMALQSGWRVGEEAVELSWAGGASKVATDNPLRTTLSSPDLDPDDHTMIELIIEDDDDDESDNEHDVAADEYDEYALLGQDNDEI